MLQNQILAAGNGLIKQYPNIEDFHHVYKKKSYGTQYTHTHKHGLFSS